MALSEIQQLRLELVRKVRLFTRSRDHWAHLSNRLAQAQAFANAQFFQQALARFNQGQPIPMSQADVDELNVVLNAEEAKLLADREAARKARAVHADRLQRAKQVDPKPPTPGGA